MSEKKHAPRVWVDHGVYEGREGQTVECFLKAVSFTDPYCPVSELAEAQAEVARLREALEKIEDEPNRLGIEADDFFHTVKAWEIASQALHAGRAASNG